MRDVRAEFSMTVPDAAAFTLLALPAAGYDVDERLEVAVDGTALDVVEERERHGTRAVRFRGGPGVLTCSYRASIPHRAAIDDDAEVERYLAASRYVEVDALASLASERFGAARGWAAVDAVRAWVARTLDYDMHRSELDDGAVATLSKRGGMCRDFAHVTIGLCRALGIPARYVSVYAPGLQPPDFHAVAEVRIDDAWWVVDATGLAPRASMVRIATGADAEETAWLTNTGAVVELRSLVVGAHDDALRIGAADALGERVRLAERPRP